MPSSLRSDYPIKTLVTTGPFSPDEGATFIGIRRYLKLAEKSYHEEAHIVKRDEVRKRIEALKSQ